MVTKLQLVVLEINNFTLRKSIEEKYSATVVNNFFGKKFQRRQKKSTPNVTQG